jgi:hypothetical protein
MSKTLFVQKSDLSNSAEYDIALRLEQLILQTPAQLRARRSGLLHVDGLRRNFSYLPDIMLGRIDMDEEGCIPKKSSRPAIVGFESVDGSLHPGSIVGMVSITWVTANASVSPRSEIRMTSTGFSIDGFSNSPHPEDSIITMYNDAEAYVGTLYPNDPVYVYEPVVPTKHRVLKKTHHADMVTPLKELFGEPIYITPVHVDRLGAGVSAASRSTVFANQHFA